MDYYDLSYGRVGAPLQGVRVKFIDWEEGGYYRTDRPNPRGEIAIGGDSVVTEYYKLGEQTREAFRTDKQGVRWFNTGDIGQMFADGTIAIIDRRKDLFKLQNGQYVSLENIEAALKSCQYVDHICVCGGDYSNELTALVSPNRANLHKLAKELGIKGSEVGDLCVNPHLRERIYAAIVRTGQSAGISTKEIPVRIHLVPDEWSPDNDMMTAAMKMKRKTVERVYRNEIMGVLFAIQLQQVFEKSLDLNATFGQIKCLTVGMFKAYAGGDHEPIRQQLSNAFSLRPLLILFCINITVVVADGNKLIQTQHGDKEVKIVREFNGAELKVTASVGNVVSVCIYAKQ
ncbi:unnamed protein product [Medioppia subpectinata]|uniref:AMP-dependent synthetase/ligase domain-containing protein n=1 Tax=Medioppia subpectinata TaxID=1979941 RepID=A0A7R9L072_9ACAR|nr:unnamed protein product [Medioppia subpectinata]CAG2112000.1 unnamed protein product [Medioppia subpectinata]